jgi:transcription antitermination factor NusG
MPSINDEIQWRVLLARRLSERKVGERLEDMGFQACVPTRKQLSLRHNCKVFHEVVLFNNYVFVATDQKRRNEALQLGNVFKYLNFVGCDATLSEREALHIQRLCGVEAPVEVTYEALQAGDEVEVLSGPFINYRGPIIALNGKTRLQLALPMMERVVIVEVGEVEVRKVG